MRITENDINTIIRHINTLEYHVNPQDSQRYASGNLWSVDIYHGVYIRRGNANPTHTSYRIPIREAWIFLTGIQYMLEQEYRKIGRL